MDDRTIVAVAPDGAEVLVILWPTGDVHVAARPDRSATWGPPLAIREDSAGSQTQRSLIP